MRKLWRFPQHLRPQGVPGFENFHTASTASIGGVVDRGASTGFHTTVRRIVENSVEVVEAEFHAMHACHGGGCRPPAGGKTLPRAFVPIYQAELTALVMSRMISVSSGWSFIIFSTRLMELRTVEW